MKTDLLSSGIFTISEAALLLGVPSRRIRWWTSNPHTAPIITKTVPSIDHRIALSFVNLVEAYFINTFSQWGMHLNSIRVMAKEARVFLNHEHPFATEMIFKTDGKKIFVQTLEKTGDPKLYDLKAHNWAMPAILEKAFKHDVLYGPSGLASLWYPRKEKSPNVVINPKIAFGKPAIEKYGVPTKTLFEAAVASNSTIASVAEWYEIPLKLVRQAVAFERQIATLH